MRAEGHMPAFALLGVRASPYLAVALAAAFYVLKRSDELQDIVSFSSRLIAAARAVESERTDALFVDPFAVFLAGPKALKRCRANVKRRQMGLPQSTTPRGIGNITCRTKYLDDAIQFFAGGGAVSAKLTQYLQQIEKLALTERNMSTELLRHAQVVLVGAGMDTRAHRLDLPPGLTWFEVDRAEVLRVKQKVLSKLKRKSTRVSVQSAGGELGRGTTLRQILGHTTFDDTSPTLWVLEGLTMYLSRDQNSELLQEMAELSSPGSMFLMSVVSAHSIGVQRDPKSLLYTWKWGFPETFFWDTKAVGWDIIDSIDYATIAHLYDRAFMRLSDGTSQVPPGGCSAVKLQPSSSMVPGCAQIVAAILQ